MDLGVCVWGGSPHLGLIMIFLKDFPPSPERGRRKESVVFCFVLFLAEPKRTGF